MTGAAPETLAAFLREIRAGTCPQASPVTIATATASANTTVSGPGPGLISRLARLSGQVPENMEVLKFGSRAVVGALTLPDEGDVVLKYYYPSTFLKHLTYGLRGSRCRQSWVAGLAFHHLGIPTPEPLMIAEWHRLGGAWLSRSFLATRRARGVTLARFVADRTPGDPLLEKVAAALRAAFTQLARHRAIHGDLKENNIIVDPDGNLSFIDLDGAGFLLPEAKWRQLREKDRRRFFKNWNSLPGIATAFRHVFDGG